jgi:hypothetical protein
MEDHGIRRSDRIDLELPIRVFGTDVTGDDFSDETRTLVVSRYGAKILLNRKVAPEQELTVCCISSRKEASVRVIGQVGKGPHYAVEILDIDFDLWGIEFPPLADSENAAARVLLECPRCRSRELTYLNEFEAEVYGASNSLSRACKRCRETTLWRPSKAEVVSGQSAPLEELKEPTQLPSTSPQRTRDERKHVRVSSRLSACIHHAALGSEVVETEDVSRGGFRFKSRRSYPQDSLIEAAVPYSPTGANIFIPARIVRSVQLPEEKRTEYGVAYIPVHKGWPGG